VLLGVVEEFEDIVTDNDTALAAKNIFDTHDCVCSMRMCGLDCESCQLYVEDWEFFSVLWWRSCFCRTDSSFPRYWWVGGGFTG